MLTAEQYVQFLDRGLLRFRAFSTADAAAMQDAVWRELRRVHGIERDNPATWRSEFPSRLAVPEVPAFLPIGDSATRTIVDELLGPGSWNLPKRWGAFHVTFPVGRTWTIPHTLWHADFPFDLPPTPRPGVKLFIFVSDVPPGGGGTLVITGSHRLVAHAVAAASPAGRADTRGMRLRLLASHPWLRALTTADEASDRAERFMGRAEVIDDVPVQVAELSGVAGEIVVTDPWLFHCRAINAGTAPRFMRSIDVYRRDCHPARFARPAPA